MGQKTNPIGFRLGINKTWLSTWFDEQHFAEKLGEDIILRRYIQHRLKVAQAQRDIFSKQATKPILQNSGGIPRRINQICDMCLLIGFNREARIIDEEIVYHS